MFNKFGMNEDDDPKKALEKVSFFSNESLGFESPFLFSCVIRVQPGATPVETMEIMDAMEIKIRCVYICR